MKPILRSTIIVFSSFVVFTLDAHARLFCEGLFIENSFYSAKLMGRKIPVTHVEIGGKKTVAVLANAATLPEMQQLYSQSLGIVVNHQTGYKNDHGMLRIDQYFIDRDVPGGRRDGEFHTTGIAWAKVQDYANFVATRKNTYNRIEVLFNLTPQEMNTAMTYQKMRRAAIIRPNFDFGGDYNPRDVNNRLTTCGEICFSFSTGSAVGRQVDAIATKLKEIKVTDPKTFVQDPEIARFLEQVGTVLLDAELSRKKLSPEISRKVIAPESLKNFTLEDINWLIGYKISYDYYELLTTLGISNSSTFSNITSPRASAVVIYDANTTVEQFLSPSYKSVGVFSTWTNQAATLLQDDR